VRGLPAASSDPQDLPRTRAEWPAGRHAGLWEETALESYVVGVEEIAWGVALVAITMVLHGMAWSGPYEASTG
jgi:hypothetical protein